MPTHPEESLGANPAEAALNPADSVAMGVPSSRAPRFLDSDRGRGFRALRHREFALLFVAFVIGQTGFWVSHISLQWVMVQLTDADPFQQGLLFFALFIPALVVAPLAGVVADRLDRRHIVIVAYCTIACWAGALATFTAADVMTPLLALGLALGLGTSFAFLSPAMLAGVANAVPEEDLSSAISLQSAANNITRIVGPALAAPILAFAGAEVSFLVYVGAAAVVVVLLARIRFTPYVPDDDRSGIVRRIADGLAHARERRPALPALGLVAVMSVFGVSHVALIPLYARAVLGGDEGTFALIAVVTGFGALIGALVTGYRRSVPTLRTGALSLLAFGAVLGAFAAVDDLGLALVLQFAVGFFYFATMTSLQTLIQHLVDESRRGRAMSLFQVAWAGLVPIGGLLLGSVAGFAGVRWTIGAGAVVCAAYGAVVALRYPSIRSTSPHSEASAASS